MPLFPTDTDDAIYLSMDDPEESLSRSAAMTFGLDELEWPTVEHYYQAMKFDNIAYRHQIRELDTPQEAVQFAKSLRRRFQVKSDWNKIKTTVMTRALYIKCRTHSKISQHLLSTGDKRIVENSQFDYFWGCGRDKRGHNHFGKILMNVRKKIREEMTNSSPS